MTTPTHEADVSWPVLCRIARQWAGESAELAESSTLLGGSVNSTFKLTMKDGQSAVLKICAHRVNRVFAHEAFQLEIMRNAGVPVPRVYNWHIGSLDDPFSYLLMEHMPGVTLGEAKRRCSAEEFDSLQGHLAELVYAMHSQRGEAFGRVREDCEPQSSWGPFFRNVYDPIVKEVSKSNQLSPKLRKTLCKIHDKVERLLPNPDCPRLVHWDLWSTNILAAPDDRGKWRVTALLDPNCKYADPEVELAYLELFHTATPAFFRSYQKQNRISPDYHRLRKHVYQLYSLVNHAYLFGHEYMNALTNQLHRVSAVV